MVLHRFVIHYSAVVQQGFYSKISVVYWHILEVTGCKPSIPLWYCTPVMYWDIEVPTNYKPGLPWSPSAWIDQTDYYHPLDYCPSFRDDKTLTSIAAGPESPPQWEVLQLHLLTLLHRSQALRTIPQGQGEFNWWVLCISAPQFYTFWGILSKFEGLGRINAWSFILCGTAISPWFSPLVIPQWRGGIAK